MSDHAEPEYDANGGEFFRVTDDGRHICSPPQAHPEQPGWRCKCGRGFLRVLVVTEGPDKAEWFEWRRAPQFDRMPF